jgi:hypothetical protein
MIGKKHTVDWNAHQGALQKLQFADKKFITKFIHQSLPMGAVFLPMGTVFHKIDATQSITCNSCKCHPKCEAHLYQYMVMGTFTIAIE